MTSRARTKKQGTTSPDADALFAPVAEAFAGDRHVTLGKMFGSTGLKVGGKVFAMVVKGNLVVKLPKQRVEELVDVGDGRYFDPGHGRLMKEWIAVAPDRVPWVELAKEARRFVEGGKR